MDRPIRHRYTDPVDLIWLACAREVALTVTRSDAVYASFDGKGTLSLATRAHFDADDSLAQLIFHELCHALVAGPEATARVDWGMENVDARDLVHEHACHRLQAALADRHGLRALFAVTTDHRAYWDALPESPLDPGPDPAIPLAREAYERATRGPWARSVEAALFRTRKVAELVREAAPPAGELWAHTRALHASGFAIGPGDDTCGECAWAFEARGLRCRQASRPRGQRAPRVAHDAVACVRFEPKFGAEACGTCGACCREAFDRVEVSLRDLTRKRHPNLVAQDGFGAHLPRPGGRCVALHGDGTRAPYLCGIYPDRPRSCAEFAIAGDACLDARRRVGQSHGSTRATV